MYFVVTFLVVAFPACLTAFRIVRRADGVQTIVATTGDAADDTSGIVYVALKLQVCANSSDAAFTISRPFPLSVANGVGNISDSPVTHAGNTPEVLGKFTDGLPCASGHCSMRGSLVQPFYDEEIAILFDCSDVECAIGQDGCHILNDTMRYLTLQLSNASSLVGFTWDSFMESSAHLSPLLIPMQDRQDPIVLRAYTAVRSGLLALKSDSNLGAVAEFVADVQAVTSIEVVRTREVLAEWIYAQLSLASHEDNGKKELAHWLLSLHAPDAYEVAAKLKYATPELCSKGDTCPRATGCISFCTAIRKALDERREEKDGVAPFFKRDARTRGLMQGHACSNAKNDASVLQILVVGAGPVGLLTAIYEQISRKLCNYKVNVQVIEKYHDLATRTNVVHLTQTSLQMLQSIGALSVMPPHQRTLLEGKDKSISISQLQRALWRVARLSRINIRRGVEFLAYCPPVEDGKWFAVTKKHAQKSELDHVRRSDWAGGSPPDDSQSPGEWLQRLCDRSSGDNEFIEFDAIVAADGPRSLVRDQARHFSEKPVFGETLSPVTMKFTPTAAYGVTINYKAVDQVAWDAKGFLRQQCDTTTAGDRHGYTFMSEHWCYHALLLFESNGTDAEQLSNGVSRSIGQQVDFASQFVPKSRLLYNARSAPDIAVFPVGFQYVKGDAAAHVMVSKAGKPMMLLIVGDAYVPGFFPLANGVNKGFERIKKLNSVGGLAKLSVLTQSAPVFETWATNYNQALQATSKGSDQAKKGLAEFRDREKNRKNRGR